jgi:hypothetical protein
VVGVSAFLGIDRIPLRLVCQIEGDALVGSVAALANGEASPVAAVARRYSQTLLTQAAQTAACNRLHPLEQRAARWLLMIYDRVESPRFRLTQEFFSYMLGAHRPSVSLAATTLQNAGLMRYSRGLVEILDPDGLVDAACGCYATVASDYEEVMGKPLTTRPRRSTD